MDSPIVEELERGLVQALLGRECAANFEKGKIADSILQKFVPALRQLSNSYNAKDKNSGKVLTGEIQAQAYALYFTPINFVKVWRLLSELGSFRDSVQVLDYGCGPGTASLAAQFYFTDKAAITAVDMSPAALKVAEQLTGFLGRECPAVKFLNANQNWDAQTYDLIIAANVLNEMDNVDSQELLSKFVSSLKSGGSLLILEPALQKATRQAMESRDWLLRKFPEITPKYPCTHRENCPMLEYSQHDWCHGELNWTRPRLVRQFDDLLGFNKHKLKFCGFIFQKHGHLGDSYRVVSFPKKSKAGFSAWLCGQKFYQIVSLAKKNRSEANSIFQKVDLLDQIEIQNWERGGHLTRDAMVSKVKTSLNK